MTAGDGTKIKRASGEAVSRVEREREQQLEARCAELLSLPILKSIFDELRAKLPTSLCYHSVEHTYDVVRETVRFALHDGLDARTIELLAIAAAYHDSGFLVQPDDNEPIGAERACEAMTAAGGYDEAEIALVKNLILDTKLVAIENGILQQQPTTELSKYLLDADLSNFGRDDFFEKISLLEKENGREPCALLLATRNLLTHHHFLTPAGNALRNAKKQANTVELDRLITARACVV